MPLNSKIQSLPEPPWCSNDWPRLYQCKRTKDILLVSSPGTLVFTTVTAIWLTGPNLGVQNSYTLLTIEDAAIFTRLIGKVVVNFEAS